MRPITASSNAALQARTPPGNRLRSNRRGVRPGRKRRAAEVGWVGGGRGGGEARSERRTRNDRQGLGAAKAQAKSQAKATVQSRAKEGRRRSDFAASPPRAGTDPGPRRPPRWRTLAPRAQEPMDLRHREHRQQSSAPVRAGTSASSKASAASRPQPAPARFSPASDDKSLHPGYDTTAHAPLNGGPRLPPPAPAHRPTSASLARSWSTDLVWIWLTLLSVTPRTLPISASVRPS